MKLAIPDMISNSYFPIVAAADPKAAAEAIVAEIAGAVVQK